MSTNIEIEVKTLINRDEYDRVLNFFKLEKKEAVEQVNFYIDTKTFDLRKHEVSLRVRKLNGFVMTLKTPLSEGLLEKSQLISENEFNQFIDDNVFPEGPIFEFIERLYVNPNSLTTLAHLKTTRINIPYNGYMLAVDMNEFGDEIDYELEMEGSSVEKARFFLEEVCEKVDIKFKENKSSKQRRALQAFKRI